MSTTANPPPKLTEPPSATAVYQPSELPQRPTGFKESGESSPPVLRPKREAKSAAAIVYVSADECAGSMCAERSNFEFRSRVELQDASEPFGRACTISFGHDRLSELGGCEAVYRRFRGGLEAV